MSNNYTFRNKKKHIDKEGWSAHRADVLEVRGSLLLPLTFGPCKEVLCLFKFIRSHNKEIQWGLSFCRGM